MANNTTVLESAAITLIKRAVELDNSGRYTESLTFYESGIQQLMQVLRCKLKLPKDLIDVQTYIRPYLLIFRIESVFGYQSDLPMPDWVMI